MHKNKQTTKKILQSNIVCSLFVCLFVTFEDSEVFPESGPDVFAPAVAAKPVHAEHARRIGHVAPKLQPVIQLDKRMRERERVRE
jgi:hypothetical protein